MIFASKVLTRLDRMLDEAADGTFCESDYDESELSRLESKWKHFLGTSVLAKEQLEKEKENIKTLLSDISHQTKTPMANIKLYTELLKESMGEDVEGQNAQMLSEIIRQTEKLEFLIQSLTKISRLERGMFALHPKKQKLDLFLEEVIDEVRPKADKKDIDIINLHSGSCAALFDWKWTREALVNVLDNAVKYSGQGSKVEVSVKEYQLYTAISVQDYGIGICEEETAKIFGRFYRGRDVQQEDGVGLGLHLAREILKKENGYIKVSSVPGEGARFSLYLPRA